MKRTIKSRVREEKVLSDKKMKGRRLRALCTAVILGSVTLGGLSAHAVDISNQSDLINSANYTDGSVLNIRDNINLESANLSGLIQNAINVQILGTGKDGYAIGGSIYNSDNDGDSTILDYGHYTLVNGSGLTFSDANVTTETSIVGEPDRGGQLTESADWNLSGGLVQNVSGGTLTVQNSKFDTGLSIDVTRRNKRVVNSRINGGIFDNGAGTTQIETSDFTGNAISNSANKTGNETLFTQNQNGSAIESHINGGLISNASGGSITLAESNLTSNVITASSSNNHADYTWVWEDEENCDGDTSEAYVSGGLLNNGGTLTINGGSISSNTISATASSLSSDVTIASVLGGVLYNTGTATLGGNLTISENSVTYSARRNDDGATTTNAQGGVVYNVADATLNLGNVTISKNSVSGGAGNVAGGAIYNLGSMVLGETGASEAELVLSENFVSGGSGSALGGAIYSGGESNLSNGKITFANNYATSNSADASGGALYNTGILTLGEADFTENYVTGNNALGGALYNSGTFTLDKGTFSENYLIGANSEQGGAIYNAGTLNLGDVTFSDNTVGDSTLNDIYFAAQRTDGDATVNSTMNVLGRTEIGSGLQSADTTAQINIQNGGNLVLVGKQTLADGTTETVGNNAGYTGALNVAQGGILTLKGTKEADTLAAALTNATKKWEVGSGLAFDIENDIAARPGQDNPPVAPDATISAADITNILGSDAKNVDIYKLGDNYITFSDDYSSVGRNVYVKDGIIRFFIENNDTEGGGEKYFNDGNANTYISDGAKFIFEISGEENDTTFAGNLISETVAGEVNKAEFQKAGDATMTLTGDNRAFNGEAVVEWGELVIVGNKSFFGENASIVVDCQRNFSGDTGMASLTYNNVAGGEFNQNITLKSEGILSINGSGRGDSNAITIKDTISFDDTTNNVINLSGADYTLNTNLGSGQNLNFSNAGITLGSGVTSLEHAITLASGSTLNLADGTANNYTFGDVTLKDATNNATNNATLDINLDGASDAIAVGGNSTGVLNIADLNFSGTGGGAIQKEIEVITGSNKLTFDANYKDTYDSGIYVYVVTTNGGSLSLIASAISANGLKYQNHVVDGERTFTFVGNNPYTIGEDLETTLAGDFTVSGKSDNASDSVFSGGDAHSFFEVSTDTTLTLENLTIQNALASDADDGIEGASANENGAVVSATGGTVNLNNVALKDNHADGNGGAIYAAGNAIIKGTSVNLSGNTAGGQGSAIYAQEGAQITLEDSVIDGSDYVIYNNGAAITLNDTSVSGTDSKIYNSGALNINSVDKNVITSAIENAGTLNLSAAADKELSISGVTGTGAEIAYNIINVNSDASKTGRVELGDVSKSTLAVNNGTAELGGVSEVDLSVNNTAVVEHISGNDITAGSITIAQGAILKELGTADTTISSVLHGSGTIQKDGTSTLTLSGSGNGADFAGDINVNNGKLVFNQAYGLNAGSDVNIKNAVVEYTTAKATLSNDTLANINLNGDAQFTVDANGATVTIADKFWTAKDATTNNNLNFNNGAYNLGFSTAGLADVLNFTDANITLSQAANGSITMNNSTLDLSNNRNAGDKYTFDNLNATHGTNNISLDLDLYVTQDRNPIADTINATAGEGILNLTKVFITNDNGQIFRYEDKNIIPVISGGNTLQLAVDDGIELLSWATNVYKYQIDSALNGKGIKINYGGPSSTDTLRDLNIYQGEEGHNNRGFNFITDASGNNSYNIYRDLDTTAAGNFTIIGTVNENGTKSVLSGELKDLVLDADTAQTRLRDNGNGTYTYLNADASEDSTFNASYVTDDVDEAGNPVKIINVVAMSDVDKNGSFFELTNATNLEISDVIIKDAYRGANETDANGYTKYGSVIYAMNQNAVVNISNVDFVGNKSAANGGAIGNVLSKEFNITNGSFDDNHSEKGLGGAIYTAFNMNIKDTDFGVNELNTHQAGVANDIYIAGNTVTFEVSDKNTNTINSGIAGVAGTVFDKTGAGTLLLNGNNKDMLGSLKISAGEVKYTADGSEDSFIGGSTEINIDSKLTMDIANSADIQGQIINNLSGYGQLVKTNNGTLNMAGDNHLFTGTMTIDGGSVDFAYEAGKNIYIAGLTDIGENGILNYSTDSEITLSNVSGTGLLNKNGSGNLNFNYMTDNGEKFNGTAYANEGTLTVNAFDFKMVANGGDIVYNAIAGQTYVLDSTSNISFADGVNTGSVTFKDGTYELDSALTGQVGDKEVIFDGDDTTYTTIHLTSTEYNTGKFTIKDALIDVADDDAFKTYTFDNLNAEEGSELSVDLAFHTEDGHQSDKIISTNGSGTLTLTTLNLRDVFYDDGLTTPPDSVEFEILGGGLKLSDLTLDDWATDVYYYTVTTDADKQSVILTADDIAHENSLREQNQKDDIRGFQFLKEDEYVIGSHLGQTADGIFTVQGIQKGDGSIISHINGGNQYSMFDVVNDNTDLRINDVEISHANKDGNGSVLSHTSDSVATITNANIHDNASTGKGGAIYVNSGTVNLEDVTFANNNHGNGANDIYIEGENTKVNYIATNDNKNSVSSGIAGNGVLEKTGDSELILSGSNENFTGNLVVSSGTLNFDQNYSTDTYIKGTTTIANAAEVVINTDLSEITTGAFAGGASSTITKTGDYDITLSGDNSQFKGTANINAGNVIWNTDDATFFGGKTNLAKEEYGIVIEGTKDAQLSNISGVGTVGKDNSGTLVLSGDNSDFHGSLAVNQGTLAIAAGTQLGNLNTGAFGNGTSINLQNTAAVENEDGSWTTNPNPASIENLNFETLEIDGDVSLYLDVDLAKEQADKISADNVTVNNNGHLVIGPDGINLVSDALVKNVSTQIVSGNIAQYVMLDDAARTAMGPIQKYMVDYANGYLSFAAQGGNTPSYGDVNPGIMASPVAAQLGGYLVQLHSYDEAFRNMDMYMLMTKEQRQAMKMKNQIASAAKNSNIVLDPTVSRYENKSGWFRPYATFENVSLDNGPKVSNVAYGSFFGAESEMYDLGHGWDGIWSVYGGYNGSHQAYDGVGIYQNGGTLGIVGMAYKGNFFTGLTANTGASVGEAQTGFGQDNFTMLMAGIASKSGYNVEFAKGKLIIQPNFTMSYSYVNTFDYHSAAGVSISSDPLHAIHLEPGIKVIGNLKNGWQPYGSVSMIWNIMDNTQFMANQVYLPELSVKPFVKYGVGVRKSWGEKFTGFFQTYITNGGRNGVGLQLGFRWMLGDKSSSKKTTSQTPQNKKVIKSMK